MSRKDRLLSKLTEENILYADWEMQNADVGENGKFPVGQHPIDHNQVGMIREKLEEWMSLTMAVKAHLRELLSVVNAAPGLRQHSQGLRDAITVLDTAEHGIQPNDLHVTLNNLHKALGGAGVPYVR